MLTRSHRFHGHTSLNFVYKHGETVRGQQVALRYVRNQRRDTYRVAVIVSRKVHKSAVARNRVRRRIYEVIRTGPVITEPYDLVVTIFSETIIDLESGELAKLVTGLLQKAGVYHSARPAPTPHGIV
jgi:ribonuclease P protein component